MRIHTRPIHHLPDEFLIGQVMYFAPLAASDGISVTASGSGFTTLTRVMNALRADSREAEDLAAAANADRKIRMLAVGQRKLFLVPRTMDIQESERLIGDLLEMAAREKICSLELTHFNFILVDWPAQIIGVILEALVCSPEPDYPRDVVINIDSGLGTSLETMVREITLKHAAPGEPGAQATDGSVEPKERP
jgi:hypothetical protein